MKYLFSVLIMTLAFTSVSFAQGPTQNNSNELEEKGPLPVMSFEEVEVNYGTIEQNSDPYRTFVFTNTGKAPLVIKSARGSCGCTVPEYSKEPVMPGAKSEIKVRYDTKRIGRFTKTITLTTNADPSQVILRIKGEVKKPAPEPAGIGDAEKTILNGGGGK